MKNLKLTNMLLVSHREKKARKIKFHPKVTVIQGENDTGKSSVIKSIQYAFGANPHKIHPKWKNADIAILIRFSIDDVPFSIYRHRNSYSLFDSNNEEVGTYSSVTLELAPALAKIFDFNLRLSDRDGNSVIPPPAYLMLPFYIDQDKGWVEPWSSFTNLSQFAYWKQRVTGYHFGLRPDKWYGLDAQRKKLDKDKDEPNRQMNAIRSVQKKVYKEISSVDFDINVEDFKSEVEQLLIECKYLSDAENRFRKIITEQKTKKIRLEAQIEIVTKTHDELSDDYKYACEGKEKDIGCPTCGAEYSNSFVERFEIAQDTETCTDLLSSLRQDLNKVIEAIGITDAELKQSEFKIKELNNILSKKQGEIRLKDLIETEGRKSLASHLDVELKESEKIISALDDDTDRIAGEMKDFDDPARRKEIVKSYGENLRKNTQTLGVYSLADSVFKNVNASIEESGSDLPRAILAYFFASLKAIEENGNATFFPIVIDAPNQQEQDPQNLKKMLEFIKNRRAEDKQLIVGLVDDANVDFEGDVIRFHKKYSVLHEDVYKDISAEMRHFETINLGIKE